MIVEIIHFISEIMIVEIIHFISEIMIGNHSFFGWKSVMILFFLHLLFNLNMFGSSCVWQNGCIGRESNPGRPRSAFYSLAGEHSTTEPPMLVVNDVVILVVITSEWAVVVRKGKSQWMKIMVEWIKNVPPMRGIEPRPRRWKRRILTTRPHGTVVGKSQSNRPADKILGRSFFFVKRVKKSGPAEIRTRITGFRVLGANHYTTGPSV